MRPPTAFQYPTWPTKPPAITKPSKPHKKLRFLFNPATSSNSTASSNPLSNPSLFLLHPVLYRNPLPPHPLHDCSNEHVLDYLESRLISHQHFDKVIKFEVPGVQDGKFFGDEGSRRIFVQDPPWISALFFNGLYRIAERELEVKFDWKDFERRKYNLLRRRQIQAETEAWERAAVEYREMVKEMCEKKLAPNLSYVKGLMLGWFEPLKEAIETEQNLQRSKRPSVRAAYAPYIDLLPADKVAVIVMHTMMALLMAGCETDYLMVVHAALQIGMAIENEVRVHKLLEKTKKNQKENPIADSLERHQKKILSKHVNDLIKRKRLFEVQNLVKNEEISPWSRDVQAKLGSRLVQILIETAHIQSPENQSDAPPDIRPAFRHKCRTMKKDPRQKTARKYGVIECDPLVRAGLESSPKHMEIPYFPMLVPPKKWKGYSRGGHLFLPSYVMRTHGCRKLQDVLKSVPGNEMYKVFQALDTLGNTKWRVNRRVLDVVDSLWAAGGNIAGLVDREDIPLPEKPASDDLAEIKDWKYNLFKAKKINRERHSQRCDTALKLYVAQKLKDEEGFYYPHNVDFRGRAYPMHQHLTHLGSDLCRGILEFAEGRPLGKSGLYWLKIHLANLFSGGVEKLSHDGRLSFVENHLDDIFDSAENPINGNQWWLRAEDPFQCLAACINLSEALKSSSPHAVISHLPIHQDGSCNGLQHYAALGRDSLQAQAVNLVVKDKPADVYTEIAVRVHEIIERESKKNPADHPNAEIAKLLIDQVDRKLIKQTVMTSVYGVTYVGAREQIKRRLQEKGHITDDQLLFTASCYAAKVTMTAMRQLFQNARGIMGWLGDCAKVIASVDEPVRWTTPLGLPVVQPYFKRERYMVKTSLQQLSLQRDGTSVIPKRQRTAFPPNFVHSIDASHMMMTAIACKEVNLHFAGVHDSFWTHACDVELMNRILREKFVELHSMPILENLLESFQRSYPTLVFPSLPERGNFDLQEVLKSPYFFN